MTAVESTTTKLNEQQLGLMIQIYHGAVRVVVYLGESAYGSDKAMDWIREVDVPADFDELPSLK